MARPAPDRRLQRAAVVLVAPVHAAGTAHAVVAAEAARAGAELILAAHAARAAAMVLFHAVMAAAWAHEPRQQREAALLPVVEALIERRGRVGDALHGGAAGRHRVGPPLQAFDRTGGRRLVVLGGPALYAQPGRFPQGLLEGRPGLFLVGVEPQPRMQRRDARIHEGAHVLRARTPDARTAKTTRTLNSRPFRALLRIHHHRSREHERRGTDGRFFP